MAQRFCPMNVAVADKAMVVRAANAFVNAEVDDNGSSALAMQVLADARKRPRQIVSATIAIAPQGHSASHIPQPLQ